MLFLDEAPEFAPKVLDSLRGPLETGEIVIGRSQAHTTFPARFQLVMALNPCPCGLADDPSGRCTCTPQQVRRYSGRLSGPILDRVDVTVRMRPLTSAHLLDASALPAGNLVQRCTSGSRKPVSVLPPGGGEFPGDATPRFQEKSYGRCCRPMTPLESSKML